MLPFPLMLLIPTDVADFALNRNSHCGDPYPHKSTCKAKGLTCKIVGRKTILQGSVKAKLYEEPITKSDGTLNYGYDSNEIYLDKVTTSSVSGRKYPSTMIDVSIKSTILRMEVDSCAEANVITYSEFLMLSGITLEPIQAKLKPYNSNQNSVKACLKLQ